MIRENGLSELIIGCSLRIHRALGPGLLESVYEKVLVYELQQNRIKSQCQVTIPIRYGELLIDLGFRLDLIVEDLVIVELKSVEQILPVHKKQLLTYLRPTGKKLGLLINFNETLLKNGITRIVNGL